MGNNKPLTHTHHDYYDKYIKRGSKRGIDPYSSTGSGIEAARGRSQPPGGKASFIPLKDLLQKNHDDRVKDYLKKMKGLSIDEIVNSGSLLQQQNQNRDEESVNGNAKQRGIVESTRNMAETLNKSLNRLGTNKGLVLTANDLRKQHSKLNSKGVNRSPSAEKRKRKDEK